MPRNPNKEATQVEHDAVPKIEAATPVSPPNPPCETAETPLPMVALWRKEYIFITSDKDVSNDRAKSSKISSDFKRLI